MKVDQDVTDGGRVSWAGESGTDEASLASRMKQALRRLAKAVVVIT